MMVSAREIEEAVAWLEAQAINYETANNYAMETTKYKREDATAWKVARLICTLAASVSKVEK